MQQEEGVDEAGLVCLSYQLACGNLCTGPLTLRVTPLPSWNLSWQIQHRSGKSCRLASVAADVVLVVQAVEEAVCQKAGAEVEG